MLRSLGLLSVALAIALTSASALPSTHHSARPSAPSRPPIVALSVEPPVVQLIGPRSLAHLIVTAQLPDGTLHDVTAQAVQTVAQPARVRLDRDGTLRPLQDGATTVTVRYAGAAATARVLVHDAAKPTPISFNNEVVPILTRAGCNQGACHGSQYGKGGFKLSLAGFDPDLDYINIARQARGRRVSIAEPTRSLLLLKPTMSVPHGGGRRLEPDSADYKVLFQWLKDGAPGPKLTDPIVTKLNAFPAERILQKGGGSQRLVVQAVYSDGTTRDVTPWTRLNSLTDGIAACTPDGVVTPFGSGQTAVMVRYAGQATVATMIVPFARPPAAALVNQGPTRRAGQPSMPSQPGLDESRPHAEGGDTGAAPTRVSHSAPSTQHSALLSSDPSAAIDALVARKQQQLGLVPSPLCEDATFARRVFFDLIGTPPTPEEMAAFQADRSPDKRAKLVDALLARPEYADYWTLKWGDLLRNNRTNLQPKGMWTFANWIHSQMQQNRPADRFVYDLLTARGSTYTNGPANYYRVATTPQDLAETTSQVFLGSRLQCAKCHHHPFEKWSQNDYYQFAAFFARVALKDTTDFGLFGNEKVVRINDDGEVNHPKTGAVMRPTLLGEPSFLPGSRFAEPDAGGDRRRILAEWLVSKQDPLFARNLANRYWGYLFGKGIVNPIDDVRVTNPPSNPALLDRLADELVRHGYDLKHLLRVICLSQTYQRSSDATPQNIKDELFFTHYLPKRLPAESMLDAIDFACGTHEKYPELPAGTRAIQLPDPGVGSDFLDVFGRPQRLIACECERVAEPNLSQTLHLMNGELVNRKVTQADGRIAKLIEAKKTDDAILDELYMVTLARTPRPAERTAIHRIMAPAKDHKPVFEDVLLTLLNSKEFLFNH